MSEIARLIQRVPPGTNIEIWLKKDGKVSGILDEITTTYLTLKEPSGALLALIPMEKVDGFLLGTKERKKSESAGKQQPSASNSPAKSVSSSASSGPGLYKQAIEILDKGKEREKALPLLKEAIEKGDNPEAALGRLVSHYFQLNELDTVIDLLDEYKLVKYGKRYNTLTEIYWQKKDYQKTIVPLKKAINELTEKTPLSKRVYMYQQMGSCYMHLEEFEKAQEWFKKIIEIKDDHIAAKRNIAICLIHLEKIEDAKQKLRELLPDEKAAELLGKIDNAGETIQIDKNRNLIDDFLTTCSKFFLARCNYEGAPETKKILKNFNGSDINKLEKLANDVQSERPIDRAKYYLSAAKICFYDAKDLGDNIGRGWRALCRSFIALGDAAVENQRLDTACEWYSEALNIDDEGKRRGSNDGSIAARSLALVHFIYASAGKYEDIPWIENDAEVPNKLESFLSNHDELEKIFPRIVYLIARSKYAAEVMLDVMYEPSIREKSLEYLQKRGIDTPAGNEVTKQKFDSFWQQLADHFQDKIKEIYLQLNSIEKVELTSLDSVEECRIQIDKIEPSLYFPQDATFLRELKRILGFVSDLRKQSGFDGKNDSCRDIIMACQGLLKDIELNPTILSIEKIYPIVSRIQQETEKHHQDIKKDLSPDVTLRLPDGMDSRTVDDPNIDVQVVIENKADRSPAITPKLLVEPNPGFFELSEEKSRREGGLGLLRGGKSEILRVPLILTDKALNEKAFSLSVRVHYRTNLEEEHITGPFEFSIRLNSDFQEIPNPYSTYAGGNPVATEDMFYGRKDFIKDVKNAVIASGTLARSFAIYGQMRSGKTSILLHLMKELRQRPEDLQRLNCLVVDVGSIGGFSPEEGASVFSQILWRILKQTQKEIRKKVKDSRFSPLSLELPQDPRDFYGHPTPGQYFISLLETFLQRAAQTPGWQQTKIIVCIDEFTYIYQYIIEGKLPGEFMHYWKTILQENLFSAILVGTDAMRKFIARFYNDFGVIEKFHVTYLSWEEAKQLIEDPIKLPNGESRYKEQSVDYIFNLTAGSPFFIQKLCYRLVLYMNKNKIKLITQADVKNLKNELLSGEQPLDADFDNIIKSGDTSSDAISKEDIEAVLKKIALNSGDGFCHRNDIKCQTRSADLDEILEDLEMRKVIERDGEKYRIKVELYKEWLLKNL